jgi:exopolysaccharide production protein ExoQ
MLTSEKRVPYTKYGNPSTSWRRLPERLAAIGVSSTIYILLFSTLPGGLGVGIEIASVCLLFASGLMGFVGNARRDRALRPFELVYFCVVLFSFFGYLYSPDEYTLQITLIASVAGVACALLSRSVSLKLIIQSATYAYVAMTATVFSVYFPAILSILNAHSANRWLLRLQPFALHPNLAGFIFGAGVILMMYGAATASNIVGSLGFSFMAALTSLIVISCSARSSLLALLVALAVTSIPLLRHLPRRGKQLLIGAYAATAACVALFFEPIWRYLIVILELDSDTRGLGSGGSGRFGMWSKGLDLLTTSPTRAFFGGGLRSADYERIGFFTENSYLTIFLESGVIIGAALIATIILGLLLSYRRLNTVGRMASADRIAVFALLAYAIVESFFNRYLVAFGNPVSILLLILYFESTAFTPSPRIVRSSRHSFAPTRPSRPSI